MPLKVVYGERNVENPNIIVLRISNAGIREIRVDDFDRPITVQFKDSKLLALDVIGQSSPSMTISFKVDTSHPNRVLLNPLLLNTREWIELQFLTDGPIERPPVTARIVGQTGVPFDIRAVPWHRGDIVSGATIFLTLLIIAGSVLMATISAPKQLPIILIGFLVLYGYAMYATVMANRVSRRTS